MIDISREQPILVRDFAKRVDKTPDTVWSWIKVGRKGRYTQGLVLLEGVKLPGGMCTTLEAYYRFVAEINREE